jgi:hypothetical protein
MNVEGISRIGRATQGVRVIQLDEDDVVVSAIRAAETAQRQGEPSDGDEAGPDETQPTEADPEDSGPPEQN